MGKPLNLANPLAITLQAVAAQTASGTSDALDLQANNEPPRTVLRLQLRVSAISGSGAGVRVFVETSPDAASWEQIGDFAAVSGVSFEKRIFAGAERYCRLRYTISGATPSVTFAVAGTAEVAYATLEEFSQLGLPLSATEQIPEEQILLALLAASSNADSYLPRRHLLPLTPPYPDVLVERTCQQAALTVLRVRGFDPDNPADRVVADAAKSAEAWLMAMAKGLIEPPWVDASPDIAEGGAAIASDLGRGW